MSRASLTLFSFLILLFLSLSNISVPHFNEISFKEINGKTSETRFLFVGDIMLGRYVETLINEQGNRYPFEGMDSFGEHYDYVIGNFEAPLAQDHVQTEVDTMNLSVATTSAQALASYFDALSLANNHALDQGDDNFTFTKDVLSAQGIVPIGHPDEINDFSSELFKHNDESISVLTLNAVSTTSMESIAFELSVLEQESAMQIVFIHWGNEYELVHSVEQETLAHFMIDHGADVIIGHHPHVVQDIALYKGAPIFYSLGNFVFDQYFSEDVQVGLGVELVLSNQDVTYRLVPFTTKHTKSSPRLMTIDERRGFLEALAARSEPDVAQQLQNSGTMEVQDALASLSNPIIMGIHLIQ